MATRSAPKEVENLLRWFVEFVDKRPEDMYDEEGFPTEELNELMHRAKRALEIT